MMAKRALLLILIGVLVTAGCTEFLGPPGTVTESVQLEDATRARVLVQMVVGELTISGGAGELMEAEFIYSANRYAPTIAYNIREDTGDLEVRQPTTTLPGVRVETEDNIWSVSLSNDVPINLLVQMGVGPSRLQLASLNLEGLDVEAGIGESEIDLTGDWESDVSGHIVAGPQRLRLLLPAHIGVRVNITGGTAEINVAGLRPENGVENGAWVNAAFNDEGPNIFLDIQAGAGPIDLEVVE
jgi:hypothetical protein